MFSTAASVNASYSGLPFTLVTEDTRLMYCLLIFSVLVQLCGVGSLEMMVRIFQCLVKAISLVWTHMFNRDVKYIPPFVAIAMTFYYVVCTSWSDIQNIPNMTFWDCIQLVLDMLFDGLGYFFGYSFALMRWWATWIFRVLALVLALIVTLEVCRKFFGISRKAALLMLAAVLLMLYVFFPRATITQIKVVGQEVEFIVGNSTTKEFAGARCKTVMLRVTGIEDREYKKSKQLPTICASVQKVVSEYHISNEQWKNRHDSLKEAATLAKEVTKMIVDALRSDNWKSELDKLRKKHAETLKHLQQQSKGKLFEAAHVMCCKMYQKKTQDDANYIACWFEVCDDALNKTAGYCKSEGITPDRDCDELGDLRQLAANVDETFRGSNPEIGSSQHTFLRVGAV